MPVAFQSSNLPYSKTGYTTRIIEAYLTGDESLRPFYSFDPTDKGLEKAIAEREKFPIDRQLLVDVLHNQYSGLSDSENVHRNIESLLDANTFTVCTAHQPNLFTGHLYFIYKILHTIKLAEQVEAKHPGKRVVPVFFMGSEDADLHELNHVYVDAKKYTWLTKQNGAVGRMKIDDAVLKIIEELSGRLSVEEHGEELVAILKQCYVKGRSMEQATFFFVHALFKDYGLVIFLPDNPRLKQAMSAIFEDDLLKNSATELVKDAAEKISANFKVQAHPREINLFFLDDGVRNRIVAKGGFFYVADTDKKFSRQEMLEQLNQHPERFSPNVILRGVMQEKLLPNLAFIGGGGELAYWLELKNLFDHYHAFYPVLILRNSFLVIEKRFNELLDKLRLSSQDLFHKPNEILSAVTRRDTTRALELNEEMEAMKKVWKAIASAANKVDPTLLAHTQALEKRTLTRLDNLEKKMLRAEKRKFESEQRQIQKVHKALFPAEGLQERSESFLLFYAKWGDEFLKALYNYTKPLEDDFCILEER